MSSIIIIWHYYNNVITIIILIIIIILLIKLLKDSFRFLYPTAKGQFTYWSQRTFARPDNRGIRLDYFVCSKDMFSVNNSDNLDIIPKPGVVDNFIISEDTVGCSDHCPVMFVAKI